MLRWTPSEVTTTTPQTLPTLGILIMGGLRSTRDMIMEDTVVGIEQQQPKRQDPLVHSSNNSSSSSSSSSNTGAAVERAASANSSTIAAIHTGSLDSLLTNSDDDDDRRMRQQYTVTECFSQSHTSGLMYTSITYAPLWYFNILLGHSYSFTSPQWQLQPSFPSCGTLYEKPLVTPENMALPGPILGTRP
jgi:hypothetical protein